MKRTPKELITIGHVFTLLQQNLTVTKLSCWLGSQRAYFLRGKLWVQFPSTTVLSSVVKSKQLFLCQALGIRSLVDEMSCVLGVSKTTDSSFTQILWHLMKSERILVKCKSTSNHKNRNIFLLTISLVTSHRQNDVDYD